MECLACHSSGEVTSCLDKPALPQLSMWGFHRNHECGAQERLPEVKFNAQLMSFILGGTETQGGQGTS